MVTQCKWIEQKASGHLQYEFSSTEASLIQSLCSILSVLDN